MVKDLTSGKIVNSMIGFTVPIFLGNLLQQFYNMADSIIVGRFVGKEAFAAVGSTGSINFLIIGFILGLSSGLTIPVAQRYGALDIPAMRRKIASAVYASIGIGLIVTIITALGTDSLLRMMNTPENIFADASIYIRIIFIGIPAILLYNLPANICRALGDSKTPLYFLLVSAILNVVLDLIFVCIFSMGVAGTAIATVISQMVSGVLCILYIRKKYDILKFKKEEWGFDLGSVKHSIGIGVPMGLQFSITAIGSVVVQTAVNAFGSDTVAAVNVAVKIQSIFVQPLEALGLTMATYCGQNLGAGNKKRIRQGVKSGLLLVLIFSLLAFVLIHPLAMPMSQLFMKKKEMTPYIIESLKKVLLYNSYFYIPLGSLLVLRNSLQGLGHGIIAMGSGLFEMGARMAVSFTAISKLSYTILCFSNPSAWVAANLILIPLYVYTINKLDRRGIEIA